MAEFAVSVATKQAKDCGKDGGRLRKWSDVVVGPAIIAPTPLSIGKPNLRPKLKVNGAEPRFSLSQVQEFISLDRGLRTQGRGYLPDEEGWTVVKKCSSEKRERAEIAALVSRIRADANTANGKRLKAASPPSSAVCYQCGLLGHFRAYCPNVHCHACHEFGHRAAACHRVPVCSLAKSSLPVALSKPYVYKHSSRSNMGGSVTSCNRGAAPMSPPLRARYNHVRVAASPMRVLSPCSVVRSVLSKLSGRIESGRGSRAQWWRVVNVNSTSDFDQFSVGDIGGRSLPGKLFFSVGDQVREVSFLIEGRLRYLGKGFGTPAKKMRWVVKRRVSPVVSSSQSSMSGPSLRSELGEVVREVPQLGLAAEPLAEIAISSKRGFHDDFPLPEELPSVERALLAPSGPNEVPLAAQDASFSGTRLKKVKDLEKHAVFEFQTTGLPLKSHEELECENSVATLVGQPVGGVSMTWPREDTYVDCGRYQCEMNMVTNELAISHSNPVLGSHSCGDSLSYPKLVGRDTCDSVCIDPTQGFNVRTVGLYESCPLTARSTSAFGGAASAGGSESAGDMRQSFSFVSL